eukprot:5188070-Pleurochrysis_carterae.AAC.1
MPRSPQSSTHVLRNSPACPWEREKHSQIRRVKASRCAPGRQLRGRAFPRGPFRGWHKSL